ncbi:3'-5' exonuclease [Anaerosinus massiliensis]|uniref:3'-5' exonuclease n=1 Tax=Massilibacillus massiliensis TaxID=1806837 RepID=UPI000AF956B2|nr:3'-5' exonuclease [Massilibacillus massiliensis]
MNFVAIDFETANYKRNSACSVAVVEVKDGKIFDSYYALIKPPNLEFEYTNIQIHGITPNDVRDKPNFAQIWRDLKPCLQNKIVVAHNASFDMSVLKSCIQEYHLEPPKFHHFCTVHIAKKVWPELENHKLGTLGQYFHIDFHHHNALDDARTCAAVALLAGEKLNSANFAELAMKINLSAKSFKL